MGGMHGNLVSLNSKDSRILYDEFYVRPFNEEKGLGCVHVNPSLSGKIFI